MNIDIKYFHEQSSKIQKIEKGDWLDLRCADASRVNITNIVEKDANGNNILTRSAIKTPVVWEEGTFIDGGNAVDVKFFRYEKGEYLMLDLGIAMQLPEGYEAYVLPRGSSFKNFTIIETNAMGIVDNSYRGDNDRWFMPVLTMDSGFIMFDERICQFRVQKKMETVMFNEKKMFNSEDRGSHGSSGTL